MRSFPGKQAWFISCKHEFAVSVNERAQDTCINVYCSTSLWAKLLENSCRAVYFNTVAIFLHFIILLFCFSCNNQ